MSKELPSLGETRWPGRCAYCGAPGADTVDHVIPECLYPPSWSPSEYLRVPAHRRCNAGFSQAEATFREDLASAGANAAAAAARDTIERSWRRPETRVRALLLSLRLREGGMIYPYRTPDTVRVVRKIVRGLAFDRGLFIGIPEELVEVTFTRFDIPPAFVPQAHVHEVRHPEIFECHAFIVDELPLDEGESAENTDIHSFWRLRFYDRVRFDAWLRHPSPVR